MLAHVPGLLETLRTGPEKFFWPIGKCPMSFEDLLINDSRVVKNTQENA
jgi:hypothetical protein